LNKRKVGDEYEIMARNYLEKQGIKILKKNYRNRFGEIDLIGSDGKTLIFFEVKYRKNKTAGYAEEAVGIKKQHMICRISDFYRLEHRIYDTTPVRYDVIAVNESEIRWIQNAFPYI